MGQVGESEMVWSGLGVGHVGRIMDDGGVGWGRLQMCYKPGLHPEAWESHPWSLGKETV
jgi:hypothetical protein